VIWGETRFDATVLDQIGFLTATYSLGLWAWSIQGLLARGYYAQGNTWAPTLIGSGLMILWLPVYGWSAHSALHLSLASSGVICLYVFVLAWHLFRHTNQTTKSSPRLWNVLPALLLSTGCAVAVTRWLKSTLDLDYAPLLTGSLYGIIAIVITVGCCYVLGNQEVRLVSQLILRRMKR
ncbi:MAG: lipid II flippase MurJ, partial [Bradymonadia bacterium]